MQAKIKAMGLMVIFMVVMGFGLKAQEKYEFATITYSTGHEKITTSYSNNTVETIKVNPKEFDGIWDQRPALLKVAELQKAGWENYTATSIQASLPIYIFYMRKKQ